MEGELKEAEIPFVEERPVAPIEEEEEEAIELGDRVLLIGGRYTKTRGIIYYRDDDLIRIMPDGVSDRLIDLPIGEEGIDPDLGLEEISIIKKRSVPTFVSLVDLRVGQRAETFGPNGEQGPKYTVTRVDAENDIADMADETGGVIDDFIQPLIGLRRDLNFAVIRTQDAAEAPKPVEAAAEGVVVEEVNAEVDFELLDEIEVPIFEEIKEIPSALRSYPDVVQKIDMLQDLLKALDPRQQKNQNKIREARRLVESMVLLRNDIVDYGKAGEIKGDKSASLETLSELLDKTEFPLAKQVLGVSKNLYLDHSTEHIISVRANKGPLDTTDVNNNEVGINYLEDIVKQGIQYFDTQMAAAPPDAVGEKSNSLPKWHTAWQGFFNEYFKPFDPNTQGEPIQLRSDRDFFRSQIPQRVVRTQAKSEEKAEEQEQAQQEQDEKGTLTGLDMAVGDAYKTLVGVEYITRQYKYSIERGLGPRYARYGDRKLLKVVESADVAEVLNYVIFPLQFSRDLGVIRSGNLAIDIGQAMKTPTLMDEILENPISDIPSSGGIISVNAAGSSLGNVEITDWLKGQAIYGNGIGSLLPYLKSFGLSGVELTVEQKDVLDKKIDAYRSSIKKIIVEMRNKLTSEVPVVTNDSLLSTEQEEAFFKQIESEPLFITALLEFSARYPSYAKNDIARFAAVYAKYADFLLSVLGSSAQGVAIERTRAVRDQFLDALRASLSFRKKLEMAGEAPTPNRCPHVESLMSIRKVKDGDDRMKLLIKFMNQFRSEKKDHWIWCAACKQHLICEHEFLILQEFLHPREKEIIHKQILLNFSGGEFQGKYICRHCGQSISEIEFDTSLEYDDEGKPMMGRSVLVDEDAVEEEELNKALAVETEEVEKIDFKDESKNLMYRTINELANLVGVYPDKESYTKMVAQVTELIGNLRSRDEYAALVKQAAKKKQPAPLEYDIYLNRYLVSFCASILLINVQTKRPDYVVRYTLQGCSNPTFIGYPLQADPANKAGIEYISCAVASRMQKESPWNLTGFQSIQNDKKRLTEVIKWVDEGIKKCIGIVDIQQSIATKKQYLLETFGAEATEGRPSDIIPDSFTPRQIIVSVKQEEGAEAPIVEAAATPNMRAQAWILEGHKQARVSGKYLPGNPFSEASCCYSPLMSPGSYWKEKAGLPVLEAKVPPQGFKGSLLNVHMNPRPIQNILGKADASIMYRLFMRLCFMGPEERIGLPHEPGYNQTCAWCKFKFPEDPRLPPPMPVYAKDSGTQKKYDEEFKSSVADKEQKELAALQTQGVVITVETFEELLDASHKKFLVQPIAVKSIPLGMEMFTSLMVVTPEPFDEFKETMNQMITEVSKLPPGADKAQMAIAYGALSEKAREFEEMIKKKLGYDKEIQRRVAEKDTKYFGFRYLIGLSPQSLGELLRSYFLLPLQRAITSIDMEATLVVQKSYQLSDETNQDIERNLNNHVNHIKTIKKHIAESDYVRDKVVELVNRLSVVVPLFTKKLRANLLPAGSLGLDYIQRVIVGGIFSEFIDSNRVPTTSDATGPMRSIVDKATNLISIFAECLSKLKTEGLNLTGEQITVMIAERNEKEKAKIIGDLDKMSKEAKTVEMLNKKLGLGKWAVGGTKAIYAYDPEQYEREKQEREAAGIFDGGNGQPIQPPTGDEEGVDVEQTKEDDA